MLDYNQLFSSTLTILTAIITSGFVLVFVEIGNRKNREYDKYEVEIRPFLIKLSAYFRLISWYSTHILVELYEEAMRKGGECELKFCVCERMA